MQPPEAPAEGAREPLVTQAIAAEAAVWLALLHGPHRSRAMQRDCLAWQARSAAHRQAFERCTDTWQEVGGVSRARIQAAVAEPAHTGSLVGRPGRMALALATLCLAAVFAVMQWPGDTYGTGVGEQRLIVLADGSRMTLNTSTEVRVQLTKAKRAVTVKQGEALFEVAKDASRPFVVGVADAQVVATGTAFLVRSTPPQQEASAVFGVTLLEGQVIVQRNEGGAESALSTPIVMAPGDRLRVDRPSSKLRQSPAQARLDRPKLDQVLAWQRGVAIFDNTPLPEAIADLNRYNKVQITLADPAAMSPLRVSGSFRTGDNKAFAQAVATLFDLVVKQRDHGFELTPGPSETAPIPKEVETDR
ncbi:FecR family protein [Roseateles cellulosilyticus]|uniref:FecR domain-containing protein n=1 Tax=Pelomonas cellulosilytica TaxID=2906762 RepID=A0ABS8XSW9_9BURK|nr:FecR domain-containing protein [Pelomonas sp. P8]